ncbi:MAG: hypothetical protein HY735_33420 [Verrucomicrobia bacterium]|nr:hypothetical protein [Verrucomicrobiota bacterium]
MRFLQAAAGSTENGGMVSENDELLARLEQVYCTNLRALERYKPRRYPGKIILFNATEPPPSIIRDAHSDDLRVRPAIARQRLECARFIAAFA